MSHVRSLLLGVVVGSLGLACSSSKEAAPTGGAPTDAGTDSSTTTPVSDDAATPTAVDSGDGGKKDPNPPASSCTAAPFVTFTATVSSIDLSETTAPLVGATVTFSTCTGFNLTTDSTGTATAQITQGIPVTPIYEDGVTVIGALGAEIPATGDVAPKVTLFTSDVAPDIPGFVQDGGNAATIAIVLQVDPSATAPCTDVTGVTLAVTGHSEAVVSYAGTGWPSNDVIGTTSSTGPNVFINGITGASHVTVTGAKTGCSVKLVTASQTGNFVLLGGSATIGLATITNLGAAVREILHIDMDAFYASVEQRDDPSLRGKPVVVGGKSRRGVVSAASYEVRKFGVYSAMPMAEALRRCPHAIVVEPHMSRYVEVSAQVFAIFKRYTPLVQGLSLDEAFLDVTASRSLFGDGKAIARRIKDEVRGELALTASAGVATSKFAAKVASDLEKPDGLVVVPDDVAAFLAPMPIERMWGIGQKTAPKLRALGYATLGDFARAPVKELERALGVWGAQVARLARGEDDREVDPSGLAKSVGAEQTYERDLTSRADIERTLLVHAERVAQRLVEEGLSARIVVVKLKYADFSLRTRRATLLEPVLDATSIHEAARRLLDGFPARRDGVRLTGVSVAGLVEGPPPRLLIGGESAEKRRKIEELVAKVKGRYGVEGMTRATLLETEESVGGVSASLRPHGRAMRKE